MVANLSEAGDRTLAVIIACPAIAVLATVTRMWCKVITMKNGFRSFHADDWWIVAATVTYLAADSAIYWGLFDGSQSNGREILEVAADLLASPSPDKVQKLQNYLESLFLGVILSFFTYFLARVSICLMYRRMFSTQPFRTICIALIAVNVVSFVAIETANLCACLPVDVFWHRDKPGHCFNFNLFALSSGIFDICLDAVTLALPVRVVLSLQMPTKTKAMVMGIFLLGGFAVITNILRVYYQYQPGGYYVNIGKAEIWYNIHGACSILCACLPTYNPLRERCGKLASTIRDRCGSSARYLLSGSGRTGVSSYKDTSNGGVRAGLDSARRRPELYHPKNESSMTELVMSPPVTHAQVHYTAGAPHTWYEAPTAAADQGRPFYVPPGAIARTTTVSVV